MIAAEQISPVVMLCVVLVLAGAIPAFASSPLERSPTISLRGCRIHLAADQPQYVGRAVEDLRLVLKEFTGRLPDLQTGNDPDGAVESAAVIEIGLASADKLDHAKQLPGEFRPEGFVLVVQSGPTAPHVGGKVEIAGRGPEGLKFGTIELIRHLQIVDKDVRIECPLTVARQPRFATRSMYAHLHWWYNWPYALRSWKLEDWQRYVDLLTHLGFNTMQMWPMMELLPHPLSDEDQAYLQKYARVIDYLHEQRGMKGFVGSCPNNITEDARGVPIEKREYFDFEKLLDPGVPDDLQRILDYRSDLYRTVPNADGYWVIDNDPGGWDGSPSSEFVDILVGHRKLIDEHCDRPAAQPVIYWMWESWGNWRRQQNYGATLAEMLNRLGQPWKIHVCNADHIEAMEAFDLVDRAIFFPYNLIEDEPSGPLTDIRFKRIQWAVDDAYRHGLRAVQGNAQTPLVQLPNIAAISFAAWDGDAAADPDVVLHSLADRLVCKDADVLVAAWKSLLETDADRCFKLADRLRELARDESARGVFSVIIGDWQRRIIEDLAMLLPIHGHAVAFEKLVGADAESAELSRTLDAYLTAAANWMERTGYHNKRLIMNKPYYEVMLYSLLRLRAKLGGDALTEQIVNPAVASARSNCAPEFVDDVTETILGQRP